MCTHIGRSTWIPFTCFALCRVIPAAHAKNLHWEEKEVKAI